MLAFGGFLSGSSFLAYVRRNLDNVLIGALFGPVSLGLYMNAYQLILNPILQVNGPIGIAVVPALSRLQSHPERYRSYYCTALLLITSITMPAILFLAVCAESVILVVLGQQWIGAVPIFVALLPAAFAGTLNIAGGWVYVSTGRTDRQFFANIVVTVMVTTGMLAGIPWGPVGIAIGFSTTFTVGLIFLIYYAFQTSPLQLRDLLSAITVPAIASSAATVVVVAIMFCRIASGNFLAETLLLASIFTVLYLAFWIALPGGKKRMNLVALITKSLLPPR
jgi:O-antigen/teichoic acid export membrane protein